jgi:hypothetical protein
MFIIYIYSNASGEGKRSVTDGHNTAVKYHREMYMRAGNASNKTNEYTTPTQEANAQLYQGGTDGSYPVLLEFDYISTK